MSDSRLERVLRRDHAVVLAALAMLIALAWAWIVWSGAAMEGAGHAPASADAAARGGMAGMAGKGLGPAFTPWSAADFLAMLLMWSVMMVGMMTPSAAPMILLYARVARKAASGGTPFAPAGWFASGYLLAWSGYALAATLLQYLLERAMLLAPMTATAGPMLAGLLLIAAGLYQWTPLKHACLVQCRSPFLFIQQHGGFRGDRG